MRQKQVSLSNRWREENLSPHTLGAGQISVRSRDKTETKYQQQERERALVLDIIRNKSLLSSNMNTTACSPLLYPSCYGGTDPEIILLLFYWRPRIVSISISITDSCSISLSVETERRPTQQYIEIFFTCCKY